MGDLIKNRKINLGWKFITTLCKQMADAIKVSSNHNYNIIDYFSSLSFVWSNFTMNILLYYLLQFLHSNECIHRDIKAQNMLLDIDADMKWCAKICDFGFARRKINNRASGDYGGVLNNRLSGDFGPALLNNRGSGDYTRRARSRRTMTICGTGNLTLSFVY